MPSFVRQTTGFAIGGVSPVALPAGCMMLLDEGLLELGQVWAAAGSASHVFSTTGAWLQRLTGAVLAEVGLA